MSELKLLNSYEVFNYTPDMIKESRETNGGKVILKGILQKADSVNQNGRIYPRYVLDREVRNYQKFVNENRALGECVPPGTEIYTAEGWKKIETIDENEVIATLNIDRNELEFHKINRKIDMQYTGKMFRFRNSKSYDMLLTPEHKVLAWDRKCLPYKITAKELYDAYVTRDSAVSHSSLRKAGSTWSGCDDDTIIIAGKSIDTDLWAAFLGIYISEGHSSGVYVEKNQRYNEVTITQHDGETCDKIRQLMNLLPWDYSERISNNGNRHDFTIKDEELHSEMIKFGGSREKFLPLYAKNWSQRLLNVLIEWLLLGDGRHRHNNKNELISEYCTSSSRLAEDVYDIMLKLGHGATINVIQPYDRRAPDYSKTGRMILAENTAPMNIVSMSYARDTGLDFRFMLAEEIDYSGKVYCVNVENSTWLMRYNGKVCWTGNCDHPDSSVINLKNVSHIVREAILEGDSVTGKIELLDTPSGKILQSLVESGVKLGISSRGVGSTKKQGDYHVVQDDFQLICWDFVSEPSTSGAFMLPEGKTITSAELKSIFNKSDRIDRLLNDILSFNKTV